MEKTKSTDKLQGLFLILLSAVFFAGSLFFYRNNCNFFHNINTINFSAHFLTFDVANVKSLVAANLLNILKIYFNGYIVSTWLLLLPGIFCLTAGISKFAGREIDIFDFLKDRKKEKLFITIIFFIAFTTVVFVHFYFLLDYPYATDEFSYVFQGEMMAAGKLKAQCPLPGESFEGANIVVHNNQWYSKYTIGFPMLLAGGILVGLPFIINALLAAGSLVLLYFIAAEIFNKTAGATAALLALFSPYFILMAGTYFPHTSSGFFTLLLTFSILRFASRKEWKYTVISGLSIVMLLLIRPADAGIITAGVTPWLLFILWKSENRLDTFKKMTAIAGGMILGVGILMLVNKFQNGNPLLFSFNQYRSYDKWGFGQVGHTPVKGIWNISYSYLRMAFWVTPFLTVGALLSFLQKKWESVFLLIPPVGFLVFYFNFFALGNVEFGARYYYPAFLLLVILAGGGIEGAVRSLMLKRGLPTGLSAVPEGNRGNNFLPAFLAMSFLFILAGVLPVLLPPIKKQYAVNKTLTLMLHDPFKTGEKTLTIIRDVPDKMTKTLVRNHWNFRDEMNLTALYLLPGKNRELIDLYKDRKAYLCYFDHENNRFSFDPYPPAEAEHPANYIFAGINYKNSLGDIDGAEKAFLKAVELTPGNPSTEYNLGYLYFETDQPEKGAEIFSRLIVSNPDFANAWYYLGRCQGNMGRRKEAADTLRLFLEKFPDTPQTDRAWDWFKYYKSGK